MIRLRFQLLMLLLAVTVLGAGCQSADSTPTLTPVQWQRVTFLASRLQPGFAINIPADWNYEVAETGIIVFNYPRLLELPDDGAAMPEGSILANMTMLTAVDVQMIGARNAAGILDTFIDPSSSGASGPKYNSNKILDIRGRDSAQSAVSIGDRDSLLLALELEGNYLLAVIVAPKDELARQAQLLNLVFDSAELRLGQ